MYRLTAIFIVSNGLLDGRFTCLDWKQPSLSLYESTSSYRRFRYKCVMKYGEILTTTRLTRMEL